MIILLIGLLTITSAAMSPLHEAVMKGNVKMVKKIANYGIREWKDPVTGDTPFDLARSYGHLEVLKALIDSFWHMIDEKTFQFAICVGLADIVHKKKMEDFTCGRNGVFVKNVQLEMTNLLDKFSKTSKTMKNQWTIVKQLIRSHLPHDHDRAYEIILFGSLYTDLVTPNSDFDVCVKISKENGDNVMSWVEDFKDKIKQGKLITLDGDLSHLQGPCKILNLTVREEVHVDLKFVSDDWEDVSIDIKTYLQTKSKLWLDVIRLIKHWSSCNMPTETKPNRHGEVYTTKLINSFTMCLLAIDFLQNHEVSGKELYEIIQTFFWNLSGKINRISVEAIFEDNDIKFKPTKHKVPPFLKHWKSTKPNNLSNLRRVDQLAYMSVLFSKGWC